MTPDEAVALLRQTTDCGITEAEHHAIADLIEYSPREMKGEDIVNPDEWEWCNKSSECFIARKKRPLTAKEVVTGTLRAADPAVRETIATAIVKDLTEAGLL